MSKVSFIGLPVIWIAAEIVAMSVGALSVHEISQIVTGDVMSRSMTPSTVLLSVVVAIVIQLWVKLNDLSGLASLRSSERQSLHEIVNVRVRALMFLLIFFVVFIFCVLGVAALASSNFEYTHAFLCGIGAGFGASITLLASLLSELNEVATFRWQIDISTQAAKARTEAADVLLGSKIDFADDEHLAGYGRIVNGESRR